MGPALANRALTRSPKHGDGAGVMTEPISNREKKRIVGAGLRKLQSKPGWNPSSPGNRDQNELQRLGDGERANQVEGQAEQCEACAKARQELGDETALCQQHLAKVMGF